MSNKWTRLIPLLALVTAGVVLIILVCGDGGPSP